MSQPECYPSYNFTHKGNTMTTSLLTKPIKPQYTRLASQLKMIQDDLVHLSGYVSQLSVLPNEQLETLDLSDQLTSIHRCLKRFETHCTAIKIAPLNDEFAEPVMEEPEWVFPKSASDWNHVRRETKHANKLVRQLTESMNKIRADLSENQDPSGIPEDILRINQTFGNALNDFVSDDFQIHG
jgi:predicted nucleotidyltransferase component of viral defense system